VDDFDAFARQFEAASASAGKPKHYLVPYYIASHPGSTVEAMIDLALRLKRGGHRPRRVQDFTPSGSNSSACSTSGPIDGAPRVRRAAVWASSGR
jgi:radical SAM superfamily enzyme YgiQ (UPF0313 family)